jgi:hypothetical protein
MGQRKSVYIKTQCTRGLANTIRHGQLLETRVKTLLNTMFIFCEYPLANPPKHDIYCIVNLKLTLTTPVVTPGACPPPDASGVIIIYFEYVRGIIYNITRSDNSFNQEVRLGHRKSGREPC